MKTLQSLLGKFFNNRFVRMPFKTRRRKVVTVILIIIFILFRFNSARKPDFEVSIFELKKQNFTESLSAAGEVKAEKSIDLAFLPTGSIEEIYARNGEWVKKGEKIARLDTTNLFQSLKIADENLRAEAASLDKVYDDLQGKENSETFAEIETRTAAERDKNSAVFSQIQAQQNLANAIITAPFDGIVSYKEGISVGKVTALTTPAFSLTDPSTVFFEAEISELDVSKLELGMKAVIELDAYSDDTFEELVETIGFESIVTSSGGTAYKARVTLSDNTANRFRLGMNGDVDFIVSEEEDILSFPTSALVEEDDKNYVWLVDNGGKVMKVEVEIGVSTTDNIEILSGLNVGDKVVERPSSKMEEGDRVKPTNGVELGNDFFRGLF